MRATVAAWVLAAGVVPAVAAERAIDLEVLVAAPPEQVWQAWTTRDGVRSFMAPDARVEARPGGAFEVWFDPLAEPGLRGADGMQFMALQPPRMLSFSWNAPPHLPQARAQRTLVVVRLEPEGEGATRVRLHHVGWGDGGEWDQAHGYFTRAWGQVLGQLRRRFESGPIDWSDWMKRLREAHALKPAGG